jgi:eukaryotic-like serine/threonine-protein kinase
MMLGMLGLVVFSGLVFGAFNLLSGRGGFMPAPGATPTATAEAPTATLPPPSATASREPSFTPEPPTATQAAAETATPAPPTETPTIAPTPAGGGSGQLAFASDRSGIPQVWVMNAEGKEPAQVTNMGDGACQPSWSPDGERLVFISPCRGFTESYPGASLFIIRRDGKDIMPLVTLPGGDFDPNWSPDGTQILFTSLRDGRPHIFLYNLADHTVKRLSPNPNYEQYPAWSSDGTRIAYQTTRGNGQPSIWIMSADGSEAREFSGNANGSAYSPAWSPLDDILIFTRTANQLWLVARQTDNAAAGEFRVNERVRPVYDPGFSPDGWWFSFTSTQDGNTDIYIMQRNGGSLTRLTEDPAADFHPTWRP